MINNKELKGIACVTLTGLLYGLLGYFGVKALEYTPHISNMLFWRFFIATVFIALFLIPQFFYQGIGKATPGVILSIFLGGAVFYVSSSYAFFIASKSIGTGLAMVIFFTYPAIVILCNWLLFRKKISKAYVVAIILISLGLMLMMELELGVNINGVLFSLLSAVSYAFYILASKRNNHINPLMAACLVSAGCAACSLMFALYNNAFHVPTEMDFWLNSLGIGIISTALPILLLLHGLKFISSEKAAILGVFEPIFVAIIGVLFLGEELAIMQIWGVAILLAGTVWSLLIESPASSG